jgi:hypothetical protein
MLKLATLMEEFISAKFLIIDSDMVRACTLTLPERYISEDGNKRDFTDRESMYFQQEKYTMGYCQTGRNKARAFTTTTMGLHITRVIGEQIKNMGVGV